MLHVEYDMVLQRDEKFSKIPTNENVNGEGRLNLRFIKEVRISFLFFFVFSAMIYRYSWHKQKHNLQAAF